MIRVLHIISNLEPGGAEIMLDKVIANLDSSRFEQVVVSLGNRGSLAAGMEAAGAKVHALNLRPNPAVLFSGFRQLRKIAREFVPNWIQGWMVHGNLFAHFAAKAAPSAKVAWNLRHTLDILTHEKLRTRALIRFSVPFSKKAHVIVSNSVAGSRDHEAIGYPEPKRRVITNGFDAERFKPDEKARREWRTKLEIPEETIVIGNSARFHPMKHQTQIVRALAKLPDVHAIIMGRGISDNPQLLELASELGVSDRLHLLGHQDAVESVYAALDIYCLSSQSVEGFPTAVAEAMACGVPAVVTDVGDAAEIVAETGIVVSPRDLDALVEGLNRMFQMDPKSLSSACRERVVTQYALAKVIAEYESLYASSGA
ncbi:MAG: glycosyltransferase [Verrucomicrobiota bacterium]